MTRPPGAAEHDMRVVLSVFAAFRSCSTAGGVVLVDQCARGRATLRAAGRVARSVACWWRTTSGMEAPNPEGGAVTARTPFSFLTGE